MAAKKKKRISSEKEYTKRLDGLERAFAKLEKSTNAQDIDLAFKRYKHAQTLSARTKPNPRSHFPKTRRGRPTIKKQFLLTKIDSQGSILSSSTFVASPLEAKAKGQAALGTKVKGRQVTRVILDDGK